MSGRRKAWRFGLAAEGIAAWFLRLKGYAILARRFKSPVGEIDIVAKRGTVLAFVEVKARAHGGAEITAHQRRRIERASLVFIQRRSDFALCDRRFDAVFVAPWRIPDHIVGAWRPDG